MPHLTKTLIQKTAILPIILPWHIPYHFINLNAAYNDIALYALNILSKIKSFRPRKAAQLINDNKEVLTFYIKALLILLTFAFLLIKFRYEFFEALLSIITLIPVSFWFILLILLFGAVLIFIVLSTLYILLLRLRDHIKLRKYRLEQLTSREQIESQFASFQTGYGRLEYVRFLQDKRIYPKGEWVNGSRPYKHNDPASSLLAQLEEQWLGLQR